MGKGDGCDPRALSSDPHFVYGSTYSVYTHCGTVRLSFASVPCFVGKGDKGHGIEHISSRFFLLSVAVVVATCLCVCVCCMCWLLLFLRWTSWDQPSSILK